MEKDLEPPVPQNADDGSPAPEPKGSGLSPENAGAPADPTGKPVFSTLQKRPALIFDIFRMLLIILSLVVAAGFILLVLPQPTVDRLAEDLQSRRGTERQERIALLYLGDEIKDNAFHIRGVVRNITTAPLEQLDAVVRLYSHDGSLLETTVLRMNKETISPDEIAQFELVYPNYKMEFAKYAVEFKLRDGGMVAYKDMRAAR